MHVTEPDPAAPRRLSRRHGMPFAALVALLAAMVVAGPVDAARPQRVRQELYRPGDFVSQTNTVQCVGASMQMMLNLTGSRNDRTASTQLALQKLARATSPKRFPSISVGTTRPRRGASSFGWAIGLTMKGAGPYHVTSAATLNEALKIGVNAMRATGRPVGLLVWHGSHAWVMSGFDATVDRFGERVTKVRSVTVLDPWYPRYSSTHGASPRPGTHLTPGQLGHDFLRWNRRRTSDFDGRYVLVLPYTIDARANTAPRAI
jgi:hypothetical protein